MKKLTLIFTLLVSTVIFSSPSYAEWTKVGVDVKGDTYYVDFESVKKHNGYIYYWVLSNYLEPDKYQGMSHKVYYKADCEISRYKDLSIMTYKEPMGRGTPITDNTPAENWKHPSPDSQNAGILRIVCSR